MPLTFLANKGDFLRVSDHEVLKRDECETETGTFGCAKFGGGATDDLLVSAVPWTDGSKA